MSANNPRSDENPNHFGHENTAVLLLAGVASDGTRSKVFEGDVALMKAVLTSKRVGVKKENIVAVYPDPTGLETERRIRRGIDEVSEKLKKSTNGHFIFYYSGHFTNHSSFVIDLHHYYRDDRLADDLKRVPAKIVLLILDMCFSALADFNVRDGYVYGSDSPDTATYRTRLGSEEPSRAPLGSGREPPIPRLWEYLSRPEPPLTSRHHAMSVSNRPDGSVATDSDWIDTRGTDPLRSTPGYLRNSNTLSSDRRHPRSPPSLSNYLNQPEVDTAMLYADERDSTLRRSRHQFPEKVVQWGSSLPNEKSWSYSSSVFTKAIHDILLSCNGKSWRRRMRREMEEADTFVTVPHLNIHVKEVVDNELKPIQTPYVKPELNEAGYNYYLEYPQFANIKAGGCCGCCPL